MSKQPVYSEPIHFYEVISNQNDKRKYQVCFGEVSWEEGKESEYAVYIRVLTFSEGNWHYQNNLSHFLVNIAEDGKSDFDNIMNKLQLMKEKYLSEPHY